MPKAKTSAPAPVSKNPRRKHYPPRKETVGVLVSKELLQHIRDYGAYLTAENGDGEHVPQSTAARELIRLGLTQVIEEVDKFLANPDKTS
jgi:hypothetical protein